MWTGFDPAAPQNGAAIDATGSAIDPVTWISVGIPENDAKSIAAGTVGMDNKKLKQARLEYRVTDGNTEYLLDGINGRASQVQNNIMATKDNVLNKQ